MNLSPYVFDVDHVAKIRSELSITVLEKKTEQNYRLKKKIFDQSINHLLKSSNTFLRRRFESDLWHLRGHCRFLCCFGRCR